MNKKFAVMIAFVALVALPVSASAATYGYITTNGSLATVTANSATEALTVATNIDAHSGVILMPQGTLPTASIVSPINSVVTPSTMTSSMMTGTSTMATGTPMMTGTSTMALSTSMMASSTTVTASSTLMTSATTTATSTVK